MIATGSFQRTIFLIGLILVCTLLPRQAAAEFEFITSGISGNVELPIGTTVDHKFNVSFKSYNAFIPDEVQKYKFTVSDIPMSGEQWFSGLPSAPLYNNLRAYLEKDVTVTGANRNINFQLGNWSKQGTPPGTAPLSLTFTLTLKKTGLEELLSSNQPLLFYLVGGDNQSPGYYWTSIPITLHITRPGQVKISGLSDVTLTEDNLSSIVNACIYSTTGKAALYFDGQNSNYGKPFKLTNNTDNNIPYTLEVKNTKQIKWREEATEGYLINEIWDVESRDENCSGESNTQFRVTALMDSQNPPPAGVYSDVMTVTVAPK